MFALSIRHFDVIIGTATTTRKKRSSHAGGSSAHISDKLNICKLWNRRTSNGVDNEVGFYRYKELKRTYSASALFPMMELGFMGRIPLVILC